MVFLRSLRKKKRFRNKSRNKNGRKMRQIGGDGYQSFSFTNRPLTLFERLFGRQQQQFSVEEILASRVESKDSMAKRDNMKAAAKAVAEAVKAAAAAEAASEAAAEAASEAAAEAAAAEAAAAKEAEEKDAEEKDAEEKEAAAETPPNTGGSNRRKSKKSKKSKKSRKSKTRHKKNKKNY